MNWQPELDTLANSRSWSYQPNGKFSAAEPAAWTTLALLTHGKATAAKRSATWLASIQQQSGAVGATVEQATPRWPTSLAMLAWQAMDVASEVPQYRRNLQAARDWVISDYGRTGPRTPQTGHDTTLAGWSWAADTHSWMEPTCFFVRALTQVGLGSHQRTQTGVQMIVDRLLPEGGCNYGNTFVLGQKLLPHVQPTGIAMWALAGHAVDDPRIEKTLEYLHDAVDGGTSAASLSFAVMGLSAHGRRPAQAAEWLAARTEQSVKRQSLSTYSRALLLLAMADEPIRTSLTTLGKVR